LRSNLKFTLQFRLLIAFTLVILLTTGAVFLMIWQATTGQIQKFSDRVEHMVMGRIQYVVTDHYIVHESWEGIDSLITQVGEQFNYHIVLSDNTGVILADSAATLKSGQTLDTANLETFISRDVTLPPRRGETPGATGQNTQGPQGPQGSAGPQGPQEDQSPKDSMMLLIGPDLTNPPPPEQSPILQNPNQTIIARVYLSPLSQNESGLTALQLLYNEIGRYFIFGALMAVVVSLIVTFFLSKYILYPVRALTIVANKWGRGELSERVIIKDKNEFGDMATTFNSMAANLQRDKQLRQEMIADTAHELRSPLTNIRGYLEAVRDNIMQPDEKTIGTIYDETMMLSRLINDLQELSLADSGELKLYLEDENVPELIKQAISAVQGKALGKGLALDMDAPSTLPQIYVDPLRIKQVLLNLLGNAISHTPKGGAITVAAVKNGDMVEISVTDTGEGIPADELENIFERFHRVDKSRTRATGGSGLGLTIARSFVEAHGGKIWAQSEQRKGSHFIFTVPVSK